MRKFWSRGFIGIASQGVNAGAGLLTALILSHFLSPSEFGHFAAIYALLFLLQTPVIALVCEPMLVHAQTRHGEDLNTYFSINFLAVSLLSAVVVGPIIIAHAFIDDLPLLSIAICLPTVFLYTSARISAFAQAKQEDALISDLGFTCTILFALGMLHVANALNLATALLALALANAVGIGVWLAKSRFRFAAPPPITMRNVISENWMYGRWLIGYHAMRWAAIMGIVPLALLILSPEDAGGMRIVQLFYQPMSQVFISLVLLLVPIASRQAKIGSASEQKQFAQKVFAGFVSSATIYALIVVLLADHLIHWLFPTAYAEYIFLMPYFGTALVLHGVVAGLSVLYRARRNTAAMLIGEIAGGAMLLMAGYLFARHWGLVGLGIAINLSYLANLTAMLLSGWRKLRAIT